MDIWELHSLSPYNLPIILLIYTYLLKTTNNPLPKKNPHKIPQLTNNNGEQQKISLNILYVFFKAKKEKIFVPKFLIPNPARLTDKPKPFCVYSNL